MLNLDSTPSNVPTGQMVLHHVLPFLHAKTKIIVNATIEMIREDRLPTHTSVL